MAEENRENEKPIRAKRATKRVLCAGVIVILIVLIGCFLWATNTLMSRSADKRLAAIEAARAIPDSENAAVIYNQLLVDYDESSFWPRFLSAETDDLTRRQPWASKDHPELADWLKEQQSTISKLLEASKKEQCRFPISTDVPYRPDRMRRLSSMRKWAFLLVWAANNDMEEGRIEGAIDKHRCLIQMAKHLRQQPVKVDYLVAMAFEAMALQRIKRFIVQSDAREKHLDTLEAALPQTKNNWPKDSSIIFKVERLFVKKHLNVLSRLAFLWRYRNIDTFNRMHEQYLRVLTVRYGTRILIAIRRHKNKNGTWPKSLDQIKSSLSKETLTDPHNNGSFVYKLTDEGFKLYSKGPNNIDEDGKYKQGADDGPIWPAYGKKAKSTGKNTNDE